MKKLTAKIVLALFIILFVVSVMASLFIWLFTGKRQDMVLTGDMVFLFILFIALIIMISFALAAEYIIIRRVKRLSEATKIIARGNLDFEIKDSSSDELAALSDNFNIMLRALRANEYLSRDFVNSVSHEFKTPITSLKGYAKLLQKNALTEEERKEYAEIILTEAERLNKLSKDLLKLSELDGANIIKQTDAFRLDEQIKRVILLMQTEWENKNIDMDVELDEIEYVGSEEYLYLVWLNLVSNAVKYTYQNGRIEIRLSGGKNIKFTIRDDGIGIKEEYRDKIFNRFFVGDKKLSPSSNGLGLSITKKIIEKLKGDISFDTEEGKGTEFTVIIPNK